MSTSANLALPFIEGGELLPDVTLNETLRLIDTLVQLAIVDRDLNAPPGSPAEGQRWIVKASPTPTGAWAGHGNHIAAWQDGGWVFCVPQIGWYAYVIDESALLAWSGTAWVNALAGLAVLQNLALLGVGTTADATNPFSAKLNNALWVAKTVAEGGDGHLRYKMSKESAAKTLSLLMQTNFSGRAEIGLTGDDDFHFKVSPDGSTWVEALTIDKTSGAAKINSGLSLTGDISPSQITADQNDYNPTGLATASVLRLSTDANSGNGRALTGLAGGVGWAGARAAQRRRKSVGLRNQNASSSAANRFQLGRNQTLQANDGIVLIYDATDSRWKTTANRSRPVGLFSVHRNGTNQSFGATGYQKIQFTTEVVDADGWFDNATNYRYTPLEPGYYLFSANTYAQGAMVANIPNVKLLKNGTDEKAGSAIDFTSAVISAGGSSVSCVVPMNGSTDYIEFFVYIANASQLLNGSTHLTYAAGCKVADL